MVEDWLPLEQLRPVRMDPNKVMTNWRFTELTRPTAPNPIESESAYVQTT